MGQVAHLCVEAFPSSKTRGLILDGLHRFIDGLHAAGIQGEVWIDGSFLTEKTDPADVDLVLRMSANGYENGSGVLQSAIENINQAHADIKAQLRCDAYVFFEWPVGDSRYARGERMRRYWLETYGMSRDREEKGIVVVVIP